jgi:adenosylcobinamide-GDP ribazoletransferase
MSFGEKIRQTLGYQVELFLLALGFFSRIPIGNNVPYSSERMNKAGRYFALVGILLGTFCGLSFIVFIRIFPPDIAILLTMVFSLLLTGCFHEDGLADMADGIGGGMTIERRLSIMKDSRIGTYGASALVMSLLAKYLLLRQLSLGYLEGEFIPLLSNNFNSPLITIFVILVVAYTFSRGVAASFIFNTPYVSDLDKSKSKPLAEKQSTRELTLIIICSLIPCIFINPFITLLLIIAGLIFRALFKKWLLARLGGFTGDCLGAAQQLMELIIYLILLALLNPNSTLALI